MAYFGARYYDTGATSLSPTWTDNPRWISPDPLMERPYDPESLNKYSYVRNDPVNLIDPDGERWVKVCATVFGVTTCQDQWTHEPRADYLFVSHGNPSAADIKQARMDLQMRQTMEAFRSGLFESAVKEAFQLLNTGNCQKYLHLFTGFFFADVGFGVITDSDLARAAGVRD